MKFIATKYLLTDNLDDQSSLHANFFPDWINTVDL